MKKIKVIAAIGLLLTVCLCSGCEELEATEQTSSSEESGSSDTTEVETRVPKKIEAGETFYAVLYDDGTAVCKDLDSGRVIEEEQTDMVDIAASDTDALGVKSDGTVKKIKYGKSRVDVSDLQNVSLVACNNDWQGGIERAFLKKDGTVEGYYAFESASSWTGITQIDVSSDAIIGLKQDGTAVAALNEGAPDSGETNVGQFSGLVQVAAGGGYSLGVTNQGNIVTSPLIRDGLVASHYIGNVQGWTNIKDVSAALYHVAGLKNDGTVVTAGADGYTYDTSSWTDIIDVDAGPNYVIGIKNDGSAVIAR